jgi:hypothetical protein
MDESMMSPAERQFYDLLENSRTMYHAMGRAKGWVDGMGRVAYVQGLQRFGKPSEANLAKFDAIRADDHLQALALRMVDQDVRTWNDLFRGY